SVLATVDLCVTPRAPRPALFPYTTLFRSVDVVLLGGAGETVRGERGDVGGGPRARHGGRGAPPAGGQRPLLQAPAAAAQARGQEAGQLVVVDVADGGDHEVVGPVVLAVVGADVLDGQRL